ncbi:MAG: TIGR04282 family arsenosugar biosynthesis glycosyltransferase [Pseudomonadota bacterium]
MKRTLIIFAKEPIAGRVKTRLGRDIGMTAAAWWYRHQSAGLVRTAARDRRWTTRLCITPDRALLCRAWGTEAVRHPQGTGDLGARMLRALRAAPPGPVALIGSDTPGANPTAIAATFDALRGHDVVLGPANDGGFWLVGLSNSQMRLPRPALKDVRWSTEHALGDTVNSLAPLRTGFADRLRDVDTGEDLRALASRPDAS